MFEENIISVVGAGGKTSIIKALAKQYKKDGYKVVITTTTHVAVSEFAKTKSYVFGTDDPSDEKQKIELVSWARNEKKPAGVCLAGTAAENAKLSTLPEEVLSELIDVAKNGQIKLLIEADGAKKHPFKVPAAHEPVILRETELVIGVLGADACGQRICDAGFRIPELTALLRKQEGFRINEEDFIKVYNSEKGLRKGVLPGMKFVPVLSKVETEEQEKMFFEISEDVEGLIAAKKGEFIDAFSYGDEAGDVKVSLQLEKPSNERTDIILGRLTELYAGIQVSVRNEYGFRIKIEDIALNDVKKTVSEIAEDLLSENEKEWFFADYAD